MQGQRRHTESDTQKAAVRWFRLRWPELAPLLFAVPNGGWRPAREAVRMVAEGVTKGVADIILLVPRRGYASLCIEFKSDIGSQSKAQRQWQKAAEGEGNRYVVVRTVGEFIAECEGYLGTESI